MYAGVTGPTKIYIFFSELERDFGRSVMNGFDADAAAAVSSISKSNNATGRLNVKSAQNQSNRSSRQQ